jgi:hypothetical protein
LLVERAEDPDEWATRLRPLLDDPSKQSHQSGEARRRATALHAPFALRAAINRFLGWARFGADV